MFLNQRQTELIEIIQQNLQQSISTEEIRGFAVELFRSLGNKRPKIETRNPIIGALNNDGEYRDSNIHEYFNNKERIEFLLFWTVNISPILEILLGVGKLPINRDNNDFEGFINNTLENFNTALKLLPDLAIISNDDIQVIVQICNDLREGISRYLEGLPSVAFEKLNMCMERIVGCNLEPSTDEVGEARPLMFKMRLGNSNQMYSREEMFHIPFELRGKVKTNRYSIPGLPCVYLGSTPLTCWEEMGKPDLNSTHTSLFLPSEQLTYFDISIPPETMAEHVKKIYELHYGEDLTELYKMLRTYIILWPLVACCSIRVMHSQDTFKPEYIIPQLLLQWIRQSSKYDGICYFSTKINNYNLKNFSFYKNYAFPVRERRTSGLCDQLRAKFSHITNAAPWQVYQLHKGRGETAIAERNTNLEFMPGLEMPYNASDFGRLETFLIHVMEVESN